ncbi:DUF3320 domain-containing protein [Acuticoccus mangrovi]|uniref:DUF3320 domain-containing protein n=1 Tax=Acuticoccus mangrovi TaxID=2796142 RepID=A0A934MP87_9HYPH|nr:DUF3320 domain-containing protein [Acuticoccus mangrovi]MBJ3778889.1 DUF3320 domain-containing protein [Acuticoccus mangrovi]
MTEQSAHDGEASVSTLSLDFDSIGKVNFAAAQNDVAVIHQLILKNGTSEAFEKLTVRLTAVPPVIRPRTWQVDRIGPQSEIALRNLSTTFDLERLGGLNEAERGELRLEVETGDATILDEFRPIRMLARDEWGGISEMAQLLAAFVSPSHSAVAELLKEASRVLERPGHSGSLEGYQSGDPQRVWLLVGAIWSAATALGLTYAEPPASFEREGQKVRGPGRIRSEGLATCLDSALLLAAAFEAVGLNPVVLFSKGHAWLGVWLVKRDFGAVTEPDVVAVRKAVQSREFIAIETTFLTRRPTIGLAEAVDEGGRLLAEEREHEFEVAVDIARCRAARIYPLASHAPPAAEAAADDNVTAAPLPKPLDFAALPSEEVEEAPDTALGRVERWQRKLLDLTLRNRLLNFVSSGQTVPLLCPDLPTLEDRLANGERFQAYALREDDPLGIRTVTPQERDRIEEGAAADAFARNQIAIPLTLKETDARLTALFRRSRSDMQEGGTNTLFLAAGFLRWRKKEGDTKSYRAPLLLIPVKLERRSAQSKFKLAHHEDEVRFNSTLIEFLKRDFDLRLPELEGDLPTDESGIDVPRILEIMRQKVRDIAGFEVVEDLALATFSFSKYLMWKDLVDRADDLRKNDLVRHLIDNPTEAFDANAPAAIEPADMDRQVDPVGLITPLPADSSQLAAVVAAVEERNFVLVGPPGTGKSQTITNIICQCLASGKSVLFVAEKAAALDVVYRNLTGQGLGDAVLELHSSKTDRKAVLSQLGRNWDRAASVEGGRWIEVTDQIRMRRDQLNAYVDALHRKGTQGFSVFDAIGWLAAAPSGPVLSFASKDAHGAERFHKLVEIAEELVRTRSIVREGPRLDAVAATDWSFAWEAAFFEATDVLAATLGAWHASYRKTCSILGLRVGPDAMPEHRPLLRALSGRLDDAALDLTRVPDIEEHSLLKAAADWETEHAELAEARHGTSVRYSDDAVRRLPVEQLDGEWREAQSKIWPFSWLAKGRVRRLLATYGEGGRPDPGQDLGRLFQMQARLQSLADNPMSMAAEGAADGARMMTVVRQALEFRRATALVSSDVDQPGRWSAAVADLVTGRDSEARRALAEHRKVEERVEQAARKFVEAGGRLDEEGDVVAWSEAVLTLQQNRSRVADWTRWLEARGAAEAAGLGPFVALVEKDDAGDDAALSLRRAYVRWWLPLALDASDELRRFAYWDHEEKIRAFRAIDEEAAKIAPSEIMRRIAHGLPARDGVPRNSELGILRHQLGLKRPSVSVRMLLSQMPETLPKLAPCVLMSPLSIAQYLPAGSQPFDVVIFDEASQITTWDAVGAIARGHQTIVVGDPKQLPPTNFFGRSDDDDDSGEAAHEKDMPSILDEVTAAGIPTRHLDWHYRSRDESLIAFSNHFFYDGRLVTFPAPATGAGAVHLHKIDGTYARGKGRTNEKEARAVVKFIRRRLAEWLERPEEARPSLGVVTFNVQQQGLIMDLLDELRREDPRLEWFFEDERKEGLIVKNLENVQGDERDVILFSITFGPDLAGKPSMNFGALNNEGGEKRLNVAVTRARQEMHVFSSITEDWIDRDRTRAKGVHDLKAFLDYADRGALALPAREEGSLGPADSPFEEAVADALRALGWDVRTQIGVSGFRIDLGVVNPDRAGSYLAGVECDGAQYHSSATARDRDKVRQSVLEQLGWCILRIWSTDWFKNQAQVVKRIHDQLSERLEADRKARTAAAGASGPEEDAAWEWSTPGEPAEHLVALPPAATELDMPEAWSLPAPDEAAADRVTFRDMPALPAPADVASDADVDRPGPGVASGGGGPSLPVPGVDPGIVAGAPEPRADDLDATRFFEPDYKPVLEQLVFEIVAQEGPLPLALVARKVSLRHGWQRTGPRISAQVMECLARVVLHEEFDGPFAWTPDAVAERVPFKGLGDRSIREVSRTEIAAVIDQNAESLASSDDPTLELARYLGIGRLSRDARGYLDQCRAWREETAAV